MLSTIDECVEEVRRVFGSRVWTEGCGGLRKVADYLSREADESLLVSYMVGLNPSFIDPLGNFHSYKDASAEILGISDLKHVYLLTYDAIADDVVTKLAKEWQAVTTDYFTVQDNKPAFVQSGEEGEVVTPVFAIMSAMQEDAIVGYIEPSNVGVFPISTTFRLADGDEEVELGYLEGAYPLVKTDDDLLFEPQFIVPRAEYPGIVAVGSDGDLRFYPERDYKFMVES